MFGRKFNTFYMEEAAGGEDVSGGGSQAQEPNANWQNDPRLDENGNPKQEQPEEQPKPESKDTPPAEEPKPAEPEVDSSAVFDTPVVKQVESLLNDAGLNPQDVTKAIMENGGKLTPALTKQLVEKHGEAVASIVADQLSTFHKASVDKATKRDQEVYNQVQQAFKDVTDQSGDKTWQELSGWAKENIPNDERKEINKLLQQGGIAARYAINDLVARFKSSDSFVQAAELVNGDNFSNDNSGLTPLSKAEYTQKFRELESKGHVYGQSKELDKLDRQRMAGLSRGL